MPYLLAAVGVFNYYLGADSVQWENNEDGQTQRKRVVFFLFWLWMPVCAAMPLVFDVLMPFNFIVGAHLSDSLSNFLVQYEATRVLAETILESVPQMLLQIFIFVYCGNDDALQRVRVEWRRALRLLALQHLVDRLLAPLVQRM